jgi:hypothetical protein
MDRKKNGKIGFALEGSSATPKGYRGGSATPMAKQKKQNLEGLDGKPPQTGQPFLIFNIFF